MTGSCGTSDVLIWKIVRETNCTYRVKTDFQIFCRSPENVTGICDRKSCPLANSQYATTRLENGKIYLTLKTPERAHMPNKMWQKIELPEDKVKAFDLINDHLQYWNGWLIEKVQQRYIRLLETLENMRIMRKQAKVKQLPIKKKVERRNKSREERALSVAHIEYRVKEELLNRLKEGVYGEIYNLEEDEFNEALDEFEEPSVEFVDESDFVEYDDEEEEIELENA